MPVFHKWTSRFFAWVQLFNPHALPVALEFESMAESTVPGSATMRDDEAITRQFPGRTFSNAISLTAGISLNEFEFPLRSGVDVMLHDGRPMASSFDPFMSFISHFAYLMLLTLTALDSASNHVASPGICSLQTWPFQRHAKIIDSFMDCGILLLHKNGNDAQRSRATTLNAFRSAGWACIFVDRRSIT